MRRIIALVGLIAPLTIGTAEATSIVFGQLNVDVFASSAPNAFGSPSWSGYTANALSSLENGLGTTGDRSLSPTAYEVLGPTYAPGDVMVTSFNSWRGVASPGVPFAGELGNRIHFGLHIYGDGGVGSTQFRLNDLTFAITSSDSNVLGFAGNFIGLDFNGTTRYGIDWGLDMMKGGGDDSIIAGAGSGLLFVDEMVYVGVGNAYWPGGPGDPLTGQAALDNTASYILANNVNITGGYCITGSDTVNYCDDVSVSLHSIPEPATLTLLGAGIMGLGAMRRRRLQKIQNA